MQVSSLLQSVFPFEPTYGQQQLFRLLDKFLVPKEDQKEVLLLKGYAGTGKTTIISSLVNVLSKFGYNYVLMAPTGRAAKVMSEYSGKKAHTIHKIIYTQKKDMGLSFSFTRRKNLLSKTIFIVDEASMISDDPDVGERGVLSDMMAYVFEKTSNKLLIVGDPAQLPPVKYEISHALDGEYLRFKYDLALTEYELTEVVRQQAASGILYNATELRKNINDNLTDIHFVTRGFKDVYKIGGEKLEDGLRYAYKKFGIENSIIVCRSNKNATLYNQYIRRTINFSEDEINAGDLVMIVKNNYTTLPEDSSAGFLANGDFAEVLKIRRYEEMHGFRFVTAEMRLTDDPDNTQFEAKIFLDTLHSYTPSLSGEEYKKLYESVALDYADITSKRDRMEAIRKDPYLNALQVKFAYALTCHKSQGGQWDAVFVDQGYLQDEAINREYLRWLYTAFTRATKELYLVNFNPSFF
ncbi:MAG TPA: AAA family ATPase [Cytophagaceae bacterium]